MRKQKVSHEKSGVIKTENIHQENRVEICIDSQVKFMRIRYIMRS